MKVLVIVSVNFSIKIYFFLFLEEIWLIPHITNDLTWKSLTMDVNPSSIYYSKRHTKSKQSVPMDISACIILYKYLSGVRISSTSCVIVLSRYYTENQFNLNLFLLSRVSFTIFFKLFSILIIIFLLFAYFQHSKNTWNKVHF